METLAANGEDSLQRLRRRVKASIARSACPASSSTVLGVGPEEQEDLRRRMDEFMLHEEYHNSTVREDGEIWYEGNPRKTEGKEPHAAGEHTTASKPASFVR